MDRCNRLLLSLVCISTLLLVSFSAHSIPSIEDYGALPTVQNMEVSPDGKLVTFLRFSSESELLVVYSLEDNKIIRALDIANIKPYKLQFLDHSRVILVASQEKRMLGYRGSHEISTAFALDATNGKISQLLTPGDEIYKGQSGLGRIVGVSADGKQVFMPAFVGEPYEESPDFSLMRVNLESVRSPRVLKKGSSNTLDYFVDPEGKVLAEEIFNNHSDYHSIVSYVGDKEVEIFRQETEIPELGVVGLTPDRKALIVIGESVNGRVSYFQVSLADGKFSAPLFERDDADVESVLTDVNRIAYGVIYSGLTPSYQFFDKELNQRVKKITAEFPGQSVWLESWSPDWRHLIIKVEGTGSSGDYFLYSKDGSSRFLASERSSITPEDVYPVVSYDYKARDGLNIPTLLTIPKFKGDKPQNLPAVMLPHGGPEYHDWLGFDWLAQALASRGYLVIQPQFRGSSGFGVQHLLAGRGEWGKKMQGDLTDGLKILIDQKLVDPNRVCIAGMSYGGYAALAGGAFSPELYKCVVAVNGVSDVRKMLKSEKSDHGKESWVLSYWQEVIAKGDTEKDTLDAISPANFPEKFVAPVLLIHGDKDDIVPYDQSKHMYKQLKKAKKAVELVKLKGEDHHLSNAETRLKMLEATLQFVDENIGSKTL